MRFGYVVRPQADRDIDGISSYLADEAGLDTGLQFLAEICQTFVVLSSQPDMGWRCPVKHRHLIGVRTFRVSARFEKYLIFYQPFQERIEILRVLHGAQDLEALFDREGVDSS